MWIYWSSLDLKFYNKTEKTGIKITFPKKLHTFYNEMDEKILILSSLQFYYVQNFIYNLKVLVIYYSEVLSSSFWKGCASCSCTFVPEQGSS